MAEFCRECFLKLHGDCVDLEKEKIILSKGEDICETCGRWNHVVDKIVKKNRFDFFIEKRFKRLRSFIENNW